MSVQLYST